MTFQVKLMFGFYNFLVSILNFVGLFFYHRLIEFVIMFFLQPFCIGILDFWILISWLVEYCITVCDARQTLKQHCVDVFCLMELQLLVQ